MFSLNIWTTHHHTAIPYASTAKTNCYNKEQETLGNAVLIQKVFDMFSYFSTCFEVPTYTITNLQTIRTLSLGSLLNI